MSFRHRAAAALLVLLVFATAQGASAGSACVPTFQRIVGQIPADDGGGPLERPWLGGWDLARPQLADEDGDGDEDLFVFEDVGRLRFYRNDGPPASPHFTFITDDYGGVHQLFFGRVVDIDSDGDLDLFVQAPDFPTDIGGSTVYRPGAFLYTNVGGPGAPIFQNLSSDPGGYVVDETGARIPMVTTSPDLVDLEGDGDKDLLFGDPSGAVFLYRNVGTPASPVFRFETDHYDDLLIVFGSCGGSDPGPHTLAQFVAALGPSLRHGYMLFSFFDLEGDGRPDLFLGDQFNSNVYYLKNQGGTPNPHFTCETESYFGQLPASGQDLVSTFGDLDGDGDPDVLVGSGTSGESGLFQFRNDGPPGAPTFSLVSSDFLPEIDVGVNSTPAFASLDGGAVPDLFLGSGSQERIARWENVGTLHAPAFTLAAPTWMDFAGAGSWSCPEFCDLDADGDLDLFLGTFAGAVRWFRNDGTSVAPSYHEVVDASFGVAASKRINAKLDADAVPRFLDDDGDGDLDLVCGQWSFTGATSLVFFRNDGTPQQPDFNWVTNDWRSLGFSGQALAPAFGDVDGDGDPDLVVGRLDGTLAYFSNEGTPAVPSFVAGPDPFAGIDVGGGANGGSVPCLVDLDGDGRVDLAVGELGGGLDLYRNVGATAPAPLAPALLDPPADAAIDGRLPYRFDWSSSTDPVTAQECTYELRLAMSPADPPWKWRIFSGLTASEATITIHEGDFRYRHYFYWTVVAHGCRPAPIPTWRRGVHATWDPRGDVGPPGTPDPVHRHPPALAVTARPVPSAADVAITLALPEAGRARVDVFDAAGRRVATLWDAAAEAGDRELRWSGRDSKGARVVPGIYFVRATLGDHAVSRRIILVR
ncbi:MAG: FG-GAP-like repeat-containing protein [bacterium]